MTTIDSTWSPRATKAARQARATITYQPFMYIYGGEMRIAHATRNRLPRQRQTTANILRDLGWGWNGVPGQCHFYHTPDTRAYQDAFHCLKGAGFTPIVSDSLHAWLAAERDQALPAGPVTRGRSKLFLT